METVIELLTKVLHAHQSLGESLNQNTPYIWQSNYPVAVVHEKDRIKEEDILAALSSAELFRNDQKTPTHYNEMMIEFFRDHAPAYLKQVSFMCLESRQPHHSYIFKAKHPHDFWKKVQNPGDFKAAVELSKYEEIKDICTIETNLRDIMRRNKEVPALKPIGFIWVAITPPTLDLRKLMQHYFIEKYKMMIHDHQIIYIGWNDRLADINMRYFVCPPNAK